MLVEKKHKINVPVKTSELHNELEKRGIVVKLIIGHGETENGSAQSADVIIVEDDNLDSSQIVADTVVAVRAMPTPLTVEEELTALKERVAKLEAQPT